MSAQLDEVLAHQRHLSTQLEKSGVIQSETLDTFMQENALNLPFRTLSEFEQFDMILTVNPSVREKFVSINCHFSFFLNHDDGIIFFFNFFGNS